MSTSHEHAVCARRSRPRGTIGVLIAAGAIALGAVATGASANSQGYRLSNQYGHHRTTHAVVHHDGYHANHIVDAGKLRINGRRIAITERGMHEQILEAFRCLGYRAWCEDGKVIVRVGYHNRPRVWWSSYAYRAKITRHGDCLIIKPIRRADCFYRKYIRPVSVKHGYGHAQHRAEHQIYRPSRSWRAAPRRSCSPWRRW